MISCSDYLNSNQVVFHVQGNEIGRVFLLRIVLPFIHNISLHKKKSYSFPLPKFTKFLMKWNKIDYYVTCMILVKEITVEPL